MSAYHFKAFIKRPKVRILFLLVFVSACSSMGIKDFFVGYADQVEPARKAIASDKVPEAKKLTPIKDRGHNAYSLSLLENGRVNFLDNDWETSKKVFAQADQKITEDDDKAKIQISRGIQKAGALASNDAAIPYDVAYYEKSMLHTYQSLNYLYENNLEGALVEVRRANIVQNQALNAYENEIYEAKSDMSKAGVDFDKATGSYPSMSEVIGNVKNGFQNAYTFYLSGVLYEAAGEPNSAYIDYKKALEIYPNNKYLQQDVLRLASLLGMHEDLIKFERLYGKYVASKVNNEGQVVFIYEDGLVNAKEEISLDLPISSSGDLRFFSFALPVYKNHKTRIIPLHVELDNENYASQEIVQIQSLAAKNLQDQLAPLITRQALRLVAKEQVRKQAAKNNGSFGSFVASMYNLASENADTRSWSTLPARVGIVRMNASEGEHNLSVRASGYRMPITVNVSPNRITLVHVTAIGSYTNYQVINL